MSEPKEKATAQDDIGVGDLFIEVDHPDPGTVAMAQAYYLRAIAVSLVRIAEALTEGGKHP